MNWDVTLEMETYIFLSHGPESLSSCCTLTKDASHFIPDVSTTGTSFIHISIDKQMLFT
jgi:hypothetical protein